MSAAGFIKFIRSETALELFRDPAAFTLLALIAWRAKRTNAVSLLGLKPNQALIGDCEACGLSQQRYRTAKSHLQKYDLATFKATSKGTIAELVDTRVFDVNTETANEQANKQPTSKPTSSQQSPNKQPTTNKNVRREECKNDDDGEAPATSAFSRFIPRIRNARPEFEPLRRQDIEGTLAPFPEATVESAVADFERDAPGMTPCPNMPLKLLAGYCKTAQAATAPAPAPRAPRQTPRQRYDAALHDAVDRLIQIHSTGGTPDDIERSCEALKDKYRDTLTIMDTGGQRWLIQDAKQIAARKYKQ